eukprot:TRINITY_DN4243_c0_g1_i8.p1 TRINITY_DN4243_c0_g1~~TRINITY_DN4243_c0_g1_i8.p1  ORF type:complete len:153 (+),score=35.72 TRINITY_DN4243_c0_g1_i8:31-489(+)
MSGKKLAPPSAQVQQARGHLQDLIDALTSPEVKREESRSKLIRKQSSSKCYVSQAELKAFEMFFQRMAQVFPAYSVGGLNWSTLFYCRMKAAQDIIPYGKVQHLAMCLEEFCNPESQAFPQFKEYADVLAQSAPFCLFPRLYLTPGQGIWKW